MIAKSVTGMWEGPKGRKGGQRSRRIHWAYTIWGVLEHEGTVYKMLSIGPDMNNYEFGEKELSGDTAD